MSHFANGLANIVAGVLEAIPLIGSAIFAQRYSQRTGPNWGSHGMKVIHTNQEHMIVVGYRIMASDIPTEEKLLEDLNPNDFTGIYRPLPWILV